MRKCDIFTWKEEMVFRLPNFRPHKLDRLGYLYLYIQFLLNLYWLKQHYMYMHVSVYICILYMYYIFA